MVVIEVGFSDDDDEAPAAPIGAPSASSSHQAKTKRNLRAVGFEDPIALGGKKHKQTSSGGAAPTAPPQAAAASSSKARMPATAHSAHAPPPPVAHSQPQHPARTLPSQQRAASLEEDLDAALLLQRQRVHGSGTSSAAGTAQQATSGPSGRSRPTSRAPSRNASRTVSPVEAISASNGAGSRAAEAEPKARLVRHILSWHSVLLPPSGGGASEHAPAALDGGAQSVPTAFDTVGGYQHHFRPLLLMELREELLKAREERASARDSQPIGGVRWGAQPPRVVPPPPPMIEDDPMHPGGMSCWEVVVEVPLHAELSELDVITLSAGGGTGSAGGGEPSWVHALRAHLPVLGVVCWREREAERDAKVKQARVHIALKSNALSPQQLAGAVHQHKTGSTGGGGSAAAAAGGGGALRLQKVGHCTSAWREWHVLHRLEPGGGGSGRGAVRPELLDQLLSAAPAAPAASTRADPKKKSGARHPRAIAGVDEWSRRDKFDRLIKAVCGCERLDDDQQSVLRHAADSVYHQRIGFSLVQGPPGTGKTTLLRGLLNVLHNAATQEYFDAVLSAVSATAASAGSSAGNPASAGGGGGADGADLLGQITSDIERTSARVRHKVLRRGGILVCAQSNGAIDELVARLLRLQFVDEYGAKYHADFVRFGHMSAESIADVTLRTRAVKLSATALGTDRGGRARTLGEQEAYRKELTAQRHKHEREQNTRATARLVVVRQQDELIARIDHAEKRNEVCTMLRLFLCPSRCVSALLLTDRSVVPCSLLST